MNIGLILSFAALLVFTGYFIYKNGRPEYYLLFTAFAFPLLDLKIIPFDYGNLKVFDGITLIALLISFKPFSRSIRRVSKKELFFFGLYVLFLILSASASSAALRALLSSVSAVTPFAFSMLLYTACCDNVAFTQKFLRALKVATLIALFFMAGQLLFGPQFTFYETLNKNVTGGEAIRYPGYFMDSQINGIFLGMISFFWLIQIPAPKKIAPVRLILFSVVLCAMVIAGSRSPLLGVAGAIVFLLLFLRGNPQFQMVRYSMICAAIVVVASSATGAFKRFEDIDKSLDFRQNIWEGAFDIFTEHPALGIGMNNYKDYVMKYAQDQSLLMDDNEILFLDHPENGYLKLMVEWGFMASLLLLGFIVWPLIRLIKNFVKGYELRTATLSAAIIVCWLISNMSVFTLADARIILLLCTAIVLVHAAITGKTTTGAL